MGAPNAGDAGLDLSVVVLALDEDENLGILLPELRAALAGLGVRSEVLVVTGEHDPPCVTIASSPAVRCVPQRRSGYGGALWTGIEEAKGAFLLTMDADLSHSPVFVERLWSGRHGADVTIASRWVAGGKARMSTRRLWLSRTLNSVYSRGLSLGARDVSSGFRLYRTDLLRGRHLRARDFDILQEILVRLVQEGHSIAEMPFEYAPRRHGRSRARLLRFAIAYARTFWTLWRLRNSITAADYDDRAYDSVIPLQRYWQRRRFAHVTRLIAGEGPVLDVGCGSSRILSALPDGSIGLDLLFAKLRYARRFGKQLVQATGAALPFRAGSIRCVLCSQVIEHLPKDCGILEEICRVLEPGGKLVIGTPDYDRWEWRLMERAYALAAPEGYAQEHISRYSRRELRRYFVDRGFALLETAYVLRGELIMAFRKGPGEAPERPPARSNGGPRR